MFRCIVIFILCLFPLLGKAELKKNNDILKSYIPYVKKTFKEWKIPGLAIAVIEDGRIIYLDSFGVKKSKTLGFINENTLFRIASLSKTMTSAMIVKLSDKKKLNLSDDIKNFIPGIKLHNKINIANILSHTSGFPSRAFTKFIESPTPYDEIKKKILTVETNCLPGKCYAYQNFIYNLAGDIVSNITKLDFCSSLKKELFAPLKMYNSSCDSKSYINSSNKAYPHVRDNGHFVMADNINSDYYKVSAAGGINSSISDMAKWLQAQMGNYPDVLSKKSLNKMHTPLIQANEEYINNRRWGRRIKSSYYGLGWRIYNYAGYKLVHHGGLLKGFTSSIAFLPNSNIGIVVLANSSSPVPTILTSKFFDLYLNLPSIDYSRIELNELLKFEKEQKMALRKK